MASKRLTPLQAIKKYCRYSCCANNTICWKLCPSKNCPLFPYRMGKRPQKKPFSEYARPNIQNKESDGKQGVLPLNFEKNDESEEGIEDEKR